MTTSVSLSVENSTFQLTSSQGGWQGLTIGKITAIIFQLTSSQGGWLYVADKETLDAVFQLTSSQGGWRSSRLCRQCHNHFNSHPHKEDDKTRTGSGKQERYFNSHPHKEDDQHIFQQALHFLVISTHILTRRMTLVQHFLLQVQHFNSHPHKEDDQSYPSTWYSIEYFNSHPHKEDDIFFRQASQYIFIFQLTSSQGGWHIDIAFRTIFTTFQLTSSQGGWPNLMDWTRGQRNFNSHPHKEDDVLLDGF